MMPARNSSGTTAGAVPARYNVRFTATGPTALVYVSVARNTRRWRRPSMLTSGWSISSRTNSAASTACSAAANS